jgi:hypothetical protein
MQDDVADAEAVGVAEFVAGGPDGKGDPDDETDVVADDEELPVDVLVRDCD